MDVSTFIRDYMARNHNGEQFLIHVAGLIETQLKEWDEGYEVYVLKLANYEMAVKNNDLYYHMTVTEDEVQALQKKEPFALDRHLWTQLKKQGLPIKKGKGNYLEQVF